MDNPDLQRSAEVRSDDRSIDASIASLAKRIGPEFREVRDDMTKKENDERRAELLRGGFDDASEVYEYGTLRLELRRAQLQGEIKDMPEGPLRQAKIDELIVVGQSEAYHEYLPMLLRMFRESMEEYKAHRAMVPKDVLAKGSVVRAEAKLGIMLSLLDEALAERTAFANMLLLHYALEDGRNPLGGPLSAADRAEFRRRYDIGLKSLRPEAVDAMKAADPQKAIDHANRLNQNILELLSGKTMDRLHGEAGFFPPAMSLELLLSAYEHAVEAQKAVIDDRNNVRARERIAELLAEAGSEKKLPAAKKEEYDRLMERLRDRDASAKKLEEQRGAYLEELLKRSSALGRFQIDAERLTAIQRQFGRVIDPTAGKDLEPATPKNVRDAIDANMEERKKFHLDRVQGILDSLEGEEGVLAITAGKRFEDFNNKTLRPFALGVAQTLAYVASLPVPETFGMKKRVREAIVGDFEKAMGIPKDKNGDPKPEKDWTPEERALVEKNARSIIDAIDEFRYKHRKTKDGKTEFELDARGNRIEKEHTKKLRETIGALRLLPPAKNYAGQPVGKMPTDRVTAKNIDDMLETHGGAAVYAKLLDQLLEDFGSLGPPPTGVMGESGEMIRKIDDVIDMHLTVAEVEIDLADDINRWMRYLIYGLIALGVLPYAKMAWDFVAARFEREKADKADTDERLKKQEQEIADLRKQLREGLEKRAGESVFEPEQGGTLPSGEALTPPATSAADIANAAAKAKANAQEDENATVDSNVDAGNLGKGKKPKINPKR